jgi:hypothetical protein
MRRFLSFLVLLGAGCWAQTPSALETDPKGWTDIMPDPSFKGWTRLPLMTTTPMAPVSQWKVDTANKVLICEGDRGHEWLRYDKELTDLILHVEYRFTKIEGGKGYNSGILVRDNADASIWHQAQAGDQSGGWLFGNTLVKGAAQRFNLRSKMPAVSPVKPAGEWNVFEVRAEGPKISVWVNGVTTPELTDLEVLKGYLGLEAEGYRIEFRNLKLKELK